MQAPKKVFLVITKANFGGAQRYIYDLATNLPKEEFTVKVIHGTDGLLVERLREAGIETHKIDALGRDVHILKDTASFFQLYQLFKRERPDIVHLNSSKIGALGSLAARFAHIPRIIFTAHGWAFNEDRSIIQKFILKVFHWITIIMAHHTIVVSKTPLRQMSSWPFVRKRMSVVYNGLNEVRYLSQSVAREELQSQISPLPKEILWVGSIAELHRNKGIDVAVNAWNTISKDAHLFIIGEGEERAALETQIKKDGLTDRVHLLGYMNAAQYITAFDIFLLPSRTEAFPYVVLEAAMAGVQIVATSVGGIPEVVTDMETGILIHPERSDEIARAITYLISNPERRLLMSKKLTEQVRQTFTLQEMVQKTTQIYNH